MQNGDRENINIADRLCYMLQDHKSVTASVHFVQGGLECVLRECRGVSFCFFSDHPYPW